MTLDDLRRALRPLSVRISNVVARAVIKRVDDSKKVQELQLDLLEGETRDEIERFGSYGLTANPPVGSEAVAIFVGGHRDHGYVVGVEDRRYRVKNLPTGEVCLYSQHGQTIVLKTNGDVEITPKAGQVVAIAGSSNPVAKGDSLNSAISTLATAIGSAVGGIPTGGAAAAALITTAVTAFNASAASALSTKVKLG